MTTCYHDYTSVVFPTTATTFRVNLVFSVVNRQNSASVFSKLKIIQNFFLTCEAQLSFTKLHLGQ